MPLFKRTKSAGQSTVDLATILAEGEDMIEQVGRAHGERWGLGSADSWNVDQTTGIISWSFSDKTAEAPVQFLGSYSSRGGSWLWAWANESLLPPLRRDAERVRAWAESNGQTSLTKPKIEGDEELASTLAAIAFRVTDSTGFYRGPGPTSAVYLTFGPVTIRIAGGAVETFNFSIRD